MSDIGQLWPSIEPYVFHASDTLQRLYADTPTPLIIAFVLGFLLAHFLRGLLNFMLLLVVAYLAMRFFDITVPGIG